jgi:hypothetical protein
MCVLKKKGGMGFRYLYYFNLAMLVRQCWCPLCEPESLYAQVLMEKYFPTGDLLNAELKKGSCYTWKSIWAGIQFFKKVYIWHVGKGENINIWNDSWVPSIPSRKIITPRGDIVYTSVSELIDPINR